jgi:hypothetical protein
MHLPRKLLCWPLQRELGRLVLWQELVLAQVQAQQLERAPLLGLGLGLEPVQGRPGQLRHRSREQR